MRPPALAGLAAVAVCLLAGACGKDDAASPATTAAAVADTTTTTTAGGGDDAIAAITASDYRYDGVPASITTSTHLQLTNTSDDEVHEIVAVRLPDDEQRSAAEIAADPAALGQLLSGGPPAAVVVAAPGGSTPGVVLGDGTLSTPGRYLLVCAVPTGADPDAYMAAAATSNGPPDVPGGPPHFTMGMVADVTVTVG